MATFKPVVLKGDIHINSKGESNIKILITHNKKTAYIKTAHYIPPSLMGSNGKVKKQHANYEYINADLKDITLGYERKIIENSKYIDRLTITQVKDLLIEERETDVDFYKFSAKRIAELKEAGKRTFISYSDSIERLKEFTKIELLPISDIDYKFLESFENHCLKAQKSVNSIAMYMRSIRALFNDAIDEYNKDGSDPLIINYPFRKFKIKTALTKDRNIELETLRKIKRIELTGYQEISRDVCMLIFYLIGVNVRDLFYCKGLQKGRFVYSRSKGKKQYSVKVEPEALQIIEKYKGEKYLLCFADHCKEERTEIKPKHARVKHQYRDHIAFNKMLNENLKDIAKNEDIKFEEPLSTYYFRYAWGNIAREVCNISMDDISLAYGHQKQSLKVTSIYVRERLERIDRVNRLVLDAV